jgi:hypothetical protein
MDEQQPASESPGPASASTAPPAAGSARDPGADRATVILGGLLAGLGLSITAAFVMHVVQEVSPVGSAFNITGDVILEFFVAGPIFGLGLAVALTALIPPGGKDNPSVSAGSLSASPPPASPGPASPGPASPQPPDQLSGR